MEKYKTKTKQKIGKSISTQALQSGAFSGAVVSMPGLNLENNESNYERMLNNRQTVLRIVDKDDEIPNDCLTYSKLSDDKSEDQKELLSAIEKLGHYLDNERESFMLQEKERKRIEQEKADEEFVRKLVAMESKQQLEQFQERRKETQTQEEKDAEFARKLAGFCTYFILYFFFFIFYDSFALLCFVFCLLSYYYFFCFFCIVIALYCFCFDFRFRLGSFRILFAGHI